jgi:hypothetical protein
MHEKETQKYLKRRHKNAYKGNTKTPEKKGHKHA